jgi:hypothetical protein
MSLNIYYERDGYVPSRSARPSQQGKRRAQEICGSAKSGEQRRIINTQNGTQKVGKMNNSINK